MQILPNADTLQLRDIAMATTFWLPTGYNFDCVIASDTLLHSRGWVFGVKLSDDDIAEIEALRDVAVAIVFGTTLAVIACDGR